MNTTITIYERDDWILRYRYGTGDECMNFSVRQYTTTVSEEVFRAIKKSSLGWEQLVLRKIIDETLLL